MIPAMRRPPCIEVIDHKVAELLRAKTGAERLKIANGIFRSVQRMIRSSLRAEHPDWAEAEIRRETGRRIAHGTVALDPTVLQAGDVHAHRRSE